jgi:hypothetical protein
VGIPSSELDQARADVEAVLMPDTFSVLTVGTTTVGVSMGQSRRTNADSETDTVPCRLRKLNGSEVLTDEGGRILADYELTVPLNTEITEQQEGIHESAATGATTRLRIAFVDARSSFALESHVLCKYVGEGQG